MKRAAFVIAIVVFVGGTAAAQVHIKDTVSISPEPEGRQLKDLDGRTVYLRYRSTITVLVTGGYDDLTDHITSMDLVLFTPESRTIISDALHKYGTSWTSAEYEAGTDFTFATIEHHESGVVDTGYVSTMDNSPVDSLYSTHCSGTIVGHWSHGGSGGLTFEVNIDVKLKDSYFEIVADSAAIHHMESTAIRLIARDSLGGEVAIPGWTAVSIAFSSDAWEWGGNYGTLQSPDGSQGWEVSGTYDDAQRGKFKFIADKGGEVCDTSIVALQAWAPDVYPASGKGQVTLVPLTPDHFEVEVEQDTIDYNTTATISIQAKDASDNDMCWSGKVFVTASSSEYGMLVSHVPPPAGKVSVGDSLRAPVKVKVSSSMRVASKKEAAVVQGRKFSTAAADATVEAEYRYAQQGDVWYAADGSRADSDVTVVFSVADADDPSISGKDSVVVRARTILLGETKYYYATEENGALTIHETDDPSSNPGESNVVFEDLTIADDAVNNDKIGAYWDYFKPDGTGLDDGMMRIIGRYWKQDTTYKVTLHCVNNSDGKDASIEIVVKKPKCLGDPEMTDVQRHSVVTDVFGVYGTPNLNLDELIIKYAGENGIPPQMIKAQMEQESSFEPKWRYEPFQDAATDLDDDIFQDNQFFITQNSMGAPFPVSHTNVQDIDYVRTQIKISKFVTDHWKSMYVQPGNTISDPDVILGSGYFTSLWRAKWDKFKKDEKIVSPKDAAHDYVKSLILDTKTDLGKTYDRLAQTRIETSYGFTQMLYATAIGIGFNAETENRYDQTGTTYMDKTNASSYPEMLNEENVLMPRYCDFLLGNLHKLFKAPIPVSQWEGKYVKTHYEGQKKILETIYCHGFEQNWIGSMYYYNGSGYGTQIWNKAHKYLPK